MKNTIQGDLKSINGKKQFPELNNEYLQKDINTFASHHKADIITFHPQINNKFEIGKTAFYVQANKQKYWFIASGYFGGERTFKCVWCGN